METFLVRLWAPQEPDNPAITPPPVGLRGVVDGGANRPRPFSGAEQLALQLEEALVERLRDRAGRSVAEGQLADEEQ
ncbi:MAG TPA: hypothetical protein VMS00_02160 [Acidimicrobiales bacterium]|nr:hypothetical protein [Acidimicrobiales bacterium]